MAKKHYSPKQRQELRATRLDQARQRLEAGVAELLSDSGAWARWLKVQAKLHRYSFNNVLLILQQRPSATMVAGFNKWVELGRHVRKGEQAIWILAPFTRKREQVDEDTGEETEVRSTYFAPVPVFDVAQTEGDPFPVPPKPIPLEGDSPEIAERFATLTATAKRLGYTVTREAPESGAEADVSKATGKIRVRPGTSGAHALASLIHEIAHVTLGHLEDGEYRRHRGIREVEAESTAYLVMEGIGLDASSYALPYVAGWSKGDPKVVVQVAERVCKAARELLDQVEDVDSSEVISLLGPALARAA